jgi:hypothetical protein
MEHWIYQEKPFTKFQAWVDILMMANHEDKKILLGNKLIEVKRGSFITSEAKLMDRWGWSKSKLRSFLKLLQNDGMITKKTDHKKTAITVVNYSVYQNKETIKEPQKDHRETIKEPLKDTNKNDKNDKNDKKYIYICAPDGARAYTAPSPGGSVEASDEVAATLEDKPSKSGPRSPFTSKRQEQLFDEFWKEYPKKKSKGQAEKTWVKIKPDEQLFKAIMDGLKRAKTSVEWKKDGGQYIPYPSTWLNAKGWEDEYELPEEDKPKIAPEIFEEYTRTATVHFTMRLEALMEEGLTFEDAYAVLIEQEEYMPKYPEIKETALENIRRMKNGGVVDGTVGRAYQI